jgi:hypothetical protein
MTFFKLAKINQTFIESECEKKFIYRNYSLLEHRNDNRFSFVYSPSFCVPLRTFGHYRPLQSFESWQYLTIFNFFELFFFVFIMVLIEEPRVGAFLEVLANI